MTASSNLPAPNLMPLMRYRDLAGAMDWLEEAFGFEKQVAVSDSDGTLIYGQMTYRGSLMMMGAVRETDLDKLMRQPDEVGGVETQSCYLVVDDADAHCARAQDAGADVVLELKSDGMGRRGYSCRDPQGHIWNFGTYNPGKGLTAAVAASPEAEAVAPPQDRPRLLMGIAALMLALVASALWLSGGNGGLSHRIALALGHQSAVEAENAYMELAKVRAEKLKAEGVAQSSRAALDKERQRRLAIETGTGATNDKLAHAENARRAAEAAVATLRDELKRKQEALDEAIEAKRVSEEKLAVMTAAATVAAQQVAKAPTVKTQPANAGSVSASNGAGNGETGTSGIETSATRPVTEEEDPSSSAIAGGEIIKDDVSRKTKISRPKKSMTKRKTAVRKTRGSSGYPEYATDLHHMWPYNSWSKRRTTVSQ